MKKILFHFDKKSHEVEVKKLQTGKSLLQEIVDEYKNINGLPKINNEDIHKIFDDPICFIGKTITEHHKITLGNGLKIKPEKVFELIDRPEGMSKFLKTHELLKEKFCNHEYEMATNHRVTTCLDINEYYYKDGTIFIKDEVIECSKEKYSYYFETENQSKAWDALMKVQDGLNSLRELHHGSLNIQSLIKDGLGVDIVGFLDSHKMEYKLNPRYIIDFDRAK